MGYVEAHGTATKIGDPIEVAALTAAFRKSTDRAGYCWLGSVKSNLGHTAAAGGVAGLIKTALMLRHRELVPTLHVRRPNPELELDSSPFRIASSTQPWPADGPLLAGVSSFGVGGTNAHVIVESAPATVRSAATSRPGVFVISAATPNALRRLENDLARVTRVRHAAAAGRGVDPGHRPAPILVPACHRRHHDAGTGGRAADRVAGSRVRPAGNACRAVGTRRRHRCAGGW
nr:polyketide synthase [Fodinicola feengrottensis]